MGNREIPIYRAWCPAAGQDANKGFSELGALDAPNAARIHAERMTHRDWTAAKYGGRSEDPMVKIAVLSPGADTAVVFVVRRRMEPVFEVVS